MSSEEPDMSGEEDLKALCANSHVEFTLSVQKLDEVAREVLVFQEEVGEAQRQIEARLARRAAALQREAAARAAAAASRSAAAKLLSGESNL